MSYLREIKFLAGLGTILVILGIFCFKAVFGKQPVTKGKAVWILVGSVSLLAGIALLVVSIIKLLDRQNTYT